MFRINTYREYGVTHCNGWYGDGKKLYDNIKSFRRGRAYFVSTGNQIKTMLNSVRPVYRMVCEELQNGTWTVIEDWSV